MKFGILAGNNYINTRIYELFSQIDPIDAEKFSRKFKSEAGDQLFHTYRELILGAELRGRGLNLMYEKEVCKKTPDWVGFSTNGEVEEIFDVVTLHQKRGIDIEIGKVVARGQAWSGWVHVSPDHVYSKIQQKAEAYTEISESLGVPYTICIFGEFTSFIEPSDIENVLYNLHGGIFKENPYLAGAVYFYEKSGTYRYVHFENHLASLKSKYLAGFQ